MHSLSGINELELSIKQLETMLADLHSSGILKCNGINLTSLEHSIKQIKAILKSTDSAAHSWDSIDGGIHPKGSIIDKEDEYNLNVVSSAKSIRIPNEEEDGDASICSEDSFVSATEFTELEVLLTVFFMLNPEILFIRTRKDVSCLVS